MAEANRLRCPRCGICYEGDATASEIQTIRARTAAPQPSCLRKTRTVFAQGHSEKMGVPINV